MHFLKWFKKQNWGINIGYISLIISLIALILSLVLIATAKFTPNDYTTTSANLVGNGFEVIYKNGITRFLTAQGYLNFKSAYSSGAGFISAPLLQLLFGIIFLLILLPIFSSLALLGLMGGYFKKWLYT